MMQNPKLQKLQETWLQEATIDDIQEKLSSSELTSKELVLLYLDRIANNDHIQSVLEVNPDALHITAALDAERKEKGSRSKLHGIPILLKDNINTADKMHTSAGSLALQNSISPKDSTVATQLREAGAIILGKTNMTEWANFMTRGMPSGYSSRGGQVLNPYGPGKFDVGGSSSGSGAAIAANFATAAIGTETSGSILSPASQNSIVGIKPTIGFVSRSGIIPISNSQDTAGPMARTVTDAVYVLNAITAIDHEDPITNTNTLLDIDFTQFLNKVDLKGVRIGIARATYFDYLKEDKLAVMNEAVRKLEGLGAEVIDVTIPSTKAKWSYDVLTYEFKTSLNAYLNSLDQSINVRSLKDVIDFNNNDRERMLRYGQTLLEDAEATSGTLTEAEYINAREKDIYLSTEQGIDVTLTDNNLEAIVFPNNFGAAIPAKAGYPSITVPAGYTGEEEPVGITFTSTAYSEPTLIQLAYAYEQATKHRKTPVLQN